MPEPYDISGLAAIEATVQQLLADEAAGAKHHGDTPLPTTNGGVTTTRQIHERIVRLHAQSGRLHLGIGGPGAFSLVPGKAP